MAFIGEKKNAHRISVGGGKGLLGRPRRRGWDNINLHLNLGWEGVDLIQLARAGDQFMAVVSKVTNLRAP